MILPEVENETVCHQDLLADLKRIVFVVFLVFVDNLVDVVEDDTSERWIQSFLPVSVDFVVRKNLSSVVELHVLSSIRESFVEIEVVVLLHDFVDWCQFWFSLTRLYDVVDSALVNSSNDKVVDDEVHENETGEVVAGKFHQRIPKDNSKNVEDWSFDVLADDQVVGAFRWMDDEESESCGEDEDEGDDEPHFDAEGKEKLLEVAVFTTGWNDLKAKHRTC
jgi:hypothetical protein